VSQASSSRAELLERLRGCIGLRVAWRGETLQLQDILATEGRLVLRSQDAAATLQADQHGDPRRRTPVLRELPVLSEDGTNPSEVAEALLRVLAEQQR
jgi:hypothetical protein